MTMSNEQRRLRYKNDADYRKKISDAGKKKYKENNEFRDNKIKYSIKYGKNHPVDKQNYLKQYYKDHKDQIMLTSKINQLNNRYEVLYWYSNGLMECNECGVNISEFLCVDHINNNGVDHRKEIGIGGDKIYRYLINNNFPNGYQILCNNCNYLKEYIRIQYKPKSQTKYAITIRNQRHNIRLQTLYWYSNGSMQCDCCNNDDIRLLTIDHINGGGKQHVIKDNITNLYEYLYYNNYPDGYKVLCWNCNKSYGQYGYCPHEFEQKNVVP